MIKVTATKARSELFSLLRRSIKGHEPIRITTREGDAILVSEDDYDSLLETMELLSTPDFKKRFAKAREEIEKGETFSMVEVFGKR